jgi:hypothetical protein
MPIARTLLPLQPLSVTALGYSLGMDNRTNDNHTDAPAVVAELLALGLSVNTLYGGVSVDYPCCHS